MKSDWVITFGVLSGACVVAGTGLFWTIYLRTSAVARQLRSGLDAMETISDEQIREMFRPSLDAEYFIRDQKFTRATARLLATPFERQWIADCGFVLYIAGAVFGAVAVVLAAVH
jgi:hypothetical protein